MVLIRRFINQFLMMMNWLEIIHMPILQSTDLTAECSLGSQDIAVLQTYPRIHFLLNSFALTENVPHIFPPPFLSVIPFHELVWVICLVLSRLCFHPGQEILENWVFVVPLLHRTLFLAHVYIPLFSWLVHSQLRLLCFWLVMHNYMLFFKECYFHI